MEKTYYFIVNTHSKTGRAREQWDILEKELKRQKVSYRAFITQGYHHATELAEQLTATEDHVDLVVAGGDGTVNEVLNGIRDLSRVTFGYIPLGSANDFARGLGLKGEPLEILKRILAADQEDIIDIGQVVWPTGSRRFVISAGIGVDAAVCRRALTSRLKKFLNRFHLGGLTYGLLTILELFKTPFLQGKAKVGEGRKLAMPKMIFCAAMNFPCEGGGVPMAPKADPRDHKLSVCCVYGIPKLVCLLAFVLLLAGKHQGLKGFDIFDTRELHLQLDQPLVVHADGEDCGDQKELTFRCLPGALHMPRI
jgi:YegS/Rv2252/BmrU family lipid kinase